ncbi:hypothetical protein Tco_0082553, partial [Tanacetum coccineum]
WSIYFGAKLPTVICIKRYNLSPLASKKATIFPQYRPMKKPLPPPSPYEHPPEDDENKEEGEDLDKEQPEGHRFPFE